MFRQASHIYHLARAGLAIARHDVIPQSRLETAPIGARLVYRLAKLVAGKPAKTSGSALNAALEELGPSYIKLGQFLATRPDFVGKERALELAALQDRLEPFEQEIAQSVVEKELGKPVNKLFAEFGPPVAAASIAQVHKARASDSDRQLAIKILRPNVKRRFRADLEQFAFAARAMETFSSEGRRLKPVSAIAVLAASVEIEMDLRMEAAAMSEMAENTKDDKGFRIPAIDWQRTSGRVLASEWIDGIPLNAPKELEKAGVNLGKLAISVMQNFLRHAIRDGFFHADMHQGNLFVDNKGNLVAVDFGITGRLSAQDRLVLAEILYGFIKRDYLRIAQVHFDAGYVPADQNVETFAQMLRAIGEPIMDKKADDISMGQLLGQLFDGTARFNMKTQPQLLLLQKTMVVVEGVARSLDPNFNMWTASEPVVRAWIERRLGPQGRLEEAADGAAALARIAADLPQALEEMRTGAAALAANARQQYDKDTSGGFATGSQIAIWIGALSLAVLALAALF